jgi:hypothetical protein
MRFMVIVKADKNSEAGALPDERLLAEMGKYNEELAKAGVLISGEGLHPSSKGARIRFSGSKRSPNPFPGTESEIEIRQVFEAEDFGAEFTPELRKQEERIRARTAAKR